MDSPCSTVFSSWLTPRWCPQCAFQSAGNAQPQMWPKLAFCKSAPVPNLRHVLVVMVCEVGLWSDEASFLNSLGAG